VSTQILANQGLAHALLGAEKCTAELYLNDVPISRLTPAGLAAEGRAIEQYLIPGTNRVEPGERPSQTRAGTRTMNLEGATAFAFVGRYAVGETVSATTGKKLAEVRFTSADLKDEPAVFPRSLIAEFDAGPAHGRWDWQDAPVLTPSNELFDEAHQVLGEIAEIFRRQSGQLYFAVTEVQCRDAMRAYPAWNEAGVRAELDEQAKMYASVDDPIVPVDTMRNDFRIVAGGRMLQCLDQDWTTSLKLRSKRGTLVPHPVLLARIGGRLRVVR
jgi:hypothetical protein